MELPKHRQDPYKALYDELTADIIENDHGVTIEFSLPEGDRLGKMTLKAKDGAVRVLNYAINIEDDQPYVRLNILVQNDLTSRDGWPFNRFMNLVKHELLFL